MPFALFLFAVSVLLSSPLPAQANGAVAGTFRIAVCKRGPCSPTDSAGAIAWGVVVLDTVTIVEPRRSRLGAHYLEGPPNGCISLARARGSIKSYAGLARGGATHWRFVPRSNALTFTLFRSPDAGYIVNVRRSGNGFEGHGDSFGGGGFPGARTSTDTPPDYTRDTVRAVRIGPPDLRLCRNEPNAS